MKSNNILIVKIIPRGARSATKNQDASQGDSRPATIPIDDERKNIVLDSSNEDDGNGH